MPTQEEIAKIIELHNNNYSQGQIAKELGKGKSTINRVLQGLGLTNGTDQERSKTKNATAARKAFSSERRIALIDAGLERLCELLPTIDKTSGMRDWFVAVGIGIDKRRLEDPPKGTNGTAAIDAYIEELSREAAKDEQEAKAQRPVEQREA